MLDAIAVCAAVWVLYDFYADLHYTIGFNRKPKDLKRVLDFVRNGKRQEEVALAIDIFLREFTKRKET